MRINIFLKANADLRDPLLYRKAGETVDWNGINECLRPRGHTARIIHETYARSDILAQAPLEIPPILRTCSYDFGPHTLQSQLQPALYEAQVDGVIFSIQPDVFHYRSVRRERTTGAIVFFEHLADTWHTEDQDWWNTHFEPLPLRSAESCMESYRHIIRRLRARRDVPIIIANLSSWMHGDTIHCYRGITNAISERIKRFNLALCDLSRDESISILDVDRLLAGAGAQRLRTGVVQLNAEGCRLIAAETVRLLDEYGCFEAD